MATVGFSRSGCSAASAPSTGLLAGTVQQTNGTPFLCHVVLPDVQLLARILEHISAAGTTFSMYFHHELWIQTMMAQDKLVAEAGLSPLFMLPGSTPIATCGSLRTKQRTSAVLGFLREHNQLAFPMAGAYTGSTSSGSNAQWQSTATAAPGLSVAPAAASGAASAATASNISAVAASAATPTAGEHDNTIVQPVMLSWMDRSGRIAIHVHPLDCPYHVHGQAIEDWPAHLMRSCQLIPEGFHTTPYIAMFEPITDVYEYIVNTQSMERIKGINVALKINSNELSNQARDTALMMFGPVMLQWKPEKFTIFGVGSSATDITEVECFQHPTARTSTDMFLDMFTEGGASASNSSSSSLVPAAAAAAASKVSSSANVNGGTGTSQSSSSSSILNSSEAEVQYAQCSVDVTAYSMISPTLLHIAARILLAPPNQPSPPWFLWIPQDTKKPVIFGGNMGNKVKVFVHIEPCQSHSIEFCPAIVSLERPDLQLGSSISTTGISSDVATSTPTTTS